ncbi:MAG TPA: NADH-quinone oxidoreductase subunit L, partial [Kofleriaceae bacterium]|nr:NADH-quinone oxidoreductase subunit L [Kofleriaceae bacterium]
AVMMCFVVSLISLLVHVYSTAYLKDDVRYTHYYAMLSLFTAAMLTLVVADNTLQILLGWEGVGLCSFALIGHWWEEGANSRAALKAFLTTRTGDIGLLIGIIILFFTVGSFDIGASNAYALSPGADHAALLAAAVCLFIGVIGKSGQFPLHTWLPDAMAGPTPVSALIHAATMVVAGVYLVARLYPVFFNGFSIAAGGVNLMVLIGGITIIIGALLAFVQDDIKKVLAYSTISQLGYMVMALGVGAWTAGVFHLFTHAFFKALLFLGAGSISHAGTHHSFDMKKDMGGLKRYMPITFWTFTIASLALAGIFPFAGFFSKDEILAGAWHVHPPGWPVWYGKLLWGGLLIAALGTAFYMWRLYFLVFSGDERSEEAKHAHESPRSMTIPLVVLAALATIAGFIGLPHLTGIHLPEVTHGLASWLSRSTVPNWYDPPHGNPAIAGHTTDTTTFVLMGIALSIGVIGIALAYRLYGKGPAPIVDKLTSGPLQPAYEASKAKLWFDEIYDATIVRPFKWVARGLFEIVDRFVIDTVAVTGVAFVVGLFGRISRWFQNGQVQRYLAGLVIGAAAVFLVTDCRSKASFTYERLPGDMIALHAAPGAGVAGANARLTWDITGDGVADLDPKTERVLEGRDVTVWRGNIRASNVTLIIEDPVTRKIQTVTRKLELAAPAKEGK